MFGETLQVKIGIALTACLKIPRCLAVATIVFVNLFGLSKLNCLVEILSVVWLSRLRHVLFNC
jgi:hypothetical protein